MSFLIFFHRALFAFILVSAFFAGALDAGRIDLLSDFLTMSLTELTNYRIIG